MLMGGITAFRMNREAFPNIDFDIIIITTIYPGASPREVEKLITNPIEEAVKEVDGIKEYTSSSIENRSGVAVFIDPDVDDTQSVIDDIKSAVDRVDDLPDDAEQPLFIEIGTDRTPVIEVGLGRIQKDGKYLITERELRDQARILEDRLLELNGVARIERRGWRDAEYHVNVDPYRLKTKYLSIEQVIRALQQRNINLPGGDIARGEKEEIIRTIGEYDNAGEIANTYIRSNDIGKGVQIKDVAHVEEDFEEAEYLDRIAGKPGIVLTVVKRESADAITMVDLVREEVEKFKKDIPDGIEVSYANDISFFIRRRLGILQSNGAIGLLLVVGSLFFFMGWRTSLMVALGIPVAIGITFIFMNYFGVTLNLISMFGLILVIGIIVDDAIIVSENFYRYMEMGHKPFDAAIKGTQEVVSPILATISTTVAAFAPLMFMTGIFGKFIYTIPLVIIIALLASLFESFFILPSHLYDVNRFGGNKVGEIKESGGWFFRFRDKYYLPVLRLVLNNRIITMLIMTFVFAGAVSAQYFIGKFVLFPAAVDAFVIKVTSERGSTLEHTQGYMEVVERAISELPESELDNYTTRVGIIQKNANDPQTVRGSNYGIVMVFLTPAVDRSVMGGLVGNMWHGIRDYAIEALNLELPDKGRSTDEIIHEIRNKTEWMLNEETIQQLQKKRSARDHDHIEYNYDVPPSLVAQYGRLKGTLPTIEFEKLKGGPPVGKPVAIEITGDDYEILLEIAKKYKGVLSTIDGIEDVDDDFDIGKDEYRLKVNENIASRAGVSVTQAAVAVNAAFNGAVATSIKRPEEEVDIRVRFAEPFRQSMDAVNKIHVMNQAGLLIPVSPMIHYSKDYGVVSLNHKDGRRMVMVTANIDDSKITSAEANVQVARKAEGIIDRYPGYNAHFGGENEDTQESLTSLGIAFLYGILIIYMILASLFKSTLQPVVVMAAIPLSLIGVVAAFILNGFLFEGEAVPLSFMSLMGIIGLSGVVVNDSIILVNFANNIRETNPHMKIKEVAMEAGAVRLRAVMLTTITTVLGLLPTAYGLGGYDPFLRPMALAFGWGLLFSTLLTLIVVPVQYTILMDGISFMKRITGLNSEDKEEAGEE